MSASLGPRIGLPAFALAVLVVTGCERNGVQPPGDVPPPRVRANEAASADGEGEPQWQDALGPRPALLVSLHPKALRADKTYGPLLRYAFALARRRSRVVAGTRVLEAVEEADEFVASVGGARAQGQAATSGETGEDEAPAGGDVVAVLRGVRGDLDPETLVDGDGRPLWAPGPTGRVRELVHERDDDGTPNPASLFELPGRTWVIASGDARSRARDAFAHPVRRPPPPETEALAELRIDGPSLVAHIRPLQPQGRLAAVGHGLRSLVFELEPGALREVRAIMAVLTYPSDPAAALAEDALRQAQDVVARKKPTGLAWLAAATVSHPNPADGSVRIAAPLSPELVEEWWGPAAQDAGAPLPAQR